MNDPQIQGIPQTSGPALAPVSGSGAGVAEELGVSSEKLRELIKPLVLIMHRKRLPFITIKLNSKGIATVSTVKPPNDRGETRCDA